MAEPAKELKDWLVDVNDDDLVGVDERSRSWAPVWTMGYPPKKAVLTGLGNPFDFGSGPSHLGNKMKYYPNWSFSMASLRRNHVKELKSTS